MLNPPSLWITINPCDLHDPIAQVFAGENSINMDDLLATLNPPSKKKRMQNIALDPYASANFFHFMIHTIGMAPPSDEMENLLKQEGFRHRVTDFIKLNLQAYLPGLESAESIKNIPNDVEVAWSRPPNPDSVNYDAKIANLELKVARAKQVHTCEIRWCLIPDKTGNYRCKRRAPFEISSEDSVDEDGHWKSNASLDI